MTPLRPAVFLDRDGTIIHDRHYLSNPAGVELLPGAGQAIARLNRAGLPVIIVTNQSGIGRGYFTEADFRATQERLAELLALAGARFDGEYHCPHGPDGSPACDCRKPAPGLFVRAAWEHGLDLAASFYVGDRVRDIAAGVGFGGTGILLAAPGGGAGETPPAGAHAVATLADAAELIVTEAPD